VEQLSPHKSDRLFCKRDTILFPGIPYTKTPLTIPHQEELRFGEPLTLARFCGLRLVAGVVRRDRQTGDTFG
jgi:hypothetical protein